MNSPRPDNLLAQRDSYAAFVAARVSEVRQRIEYARSKSTFGQSVTLIAVTKTHGAAAVEAAWLAGVTDVGENRIQEAEQKMEAVSVPVRWHLIGHLQRNKARSALRFGLVHSVDSERLAAAIDTAASARNCVQEVLVQVNVSGETTKGGFAISDVPRFADRLHAFRNLRVTGVMTIAPFEAREFELRQLFSGARRVAEQLQTAGHQATQLSMGMSGDFEIAVEEGATLVRLGTLLFGNRSPT